MDPKHPAAQAKVREYDGLVDRLASGTGLGTGTPDWAAATAALKWLHPHWTDAQRSDALARDVTDAKWRIPEVDP